MNFELVIATLAQAGIQFIVVGGVAMMTHGVARVTQDLDIRYSRSRENVGRIAQTLAPYHPRLRGAQEGPPFRFDEQTIKHGLNFTLITDLGDLDLLGEISGIGSYEAVYALSQQVEHPPGTKWRLLTVEGLILAKRSAGRKKDLDVIPDLEAIREMPPGLDRKQKPPRDS